jgi:hypothetical protein
MKAMSNKMEVLCPYDLYTAPKLNMGNIYVCTVSLTKLKMSKYLLNK